MFVFKEPLKYGHPINAATPLIWLDFCGPLVNEFTGMLLFVNISQTYQYLSSLIKENHDCDGVWISDIR